MKGGEGMASGNGQVGAFIAERRKAKSWSQKDLARVLSVTEQAVSRWERGVGDPDVTMLKPWALALDVSVAELLEGRMLNDGDTGDAADKHREVRQAVEHSLDYYLMSSMEERKPLREMIATAGFWMHLWIVAAIVFFLLGRWAFPSVPGEILAGYLFCFGSLLGLFFIGRIRSMAAEYHVIAPDNDTDDGIHENSDEKKDYGDYPNVAVGPMFGGLEKPIAVILAKRDRPGTKAGDIFCWACKLVALVFLAGTGGMVLFSQPALTSLDILICLFFPFAVTGLGFLLTGMRTLLVDKNIDEELWSGKRQILYGFLCWGAGAVIILALLLFSYVYWYIL